MRTFSLDSTALPALAGLIAADFLRLTVDRDLPLALGAQFRYVGSFRQDSGVYAGEVEAYAALDLNLVYQLPFDRNLRLSVDISNVLDNKHRTFIGAPEIGRMAFAQLGTSF